MTSLSLILVAGARSQLRWAKQHVFYWAILTPVVLIGAYLIAARVASNLGAWQPPAPAAFSFALLAEAFIVGLALSRVCSELYHIRRPESGFEAMALDATTHLHVALTTRLARTTVSGAALLAAGALIGGREVGLSVVPRVVAFAALTAMAQIWAALGWVHWQRKKGWWTAAVCVLILLITIGAFGGPLILSLTAPHYIPGRADPELTLGGLVWSGLLYLAASSAHARWRADDLEHARRIHPTRRRSRIYAWLVRDHSQRAVRAQLARDLILTLRVFSAGVYAAAGIALLAQAGLLVVLATGVLPPAEMKGGLLDATWLPAAMASKAACVLGTASFASLVPVLVAHQGPRFWLERAAGTTGHQIWLAKLWYARAVSAATPVVAWLIVAVSGQVPVFYLAPLLAECVFLWWFVSSFMGALAFETPGSPGTSVVMIAGTGSALGLAAAFAWPVGLLIYGYAMHSLTQRGRVTARYYLIRGED